MSSNTLVLSHEIINDLWLEGDHYGIAMLIPIAPKIRDTSHNWTGAYKRFAINMVDHAFRRHIVIYI